MRSKDVAIAAGIAVAAGVTLPFLKTFYLDMSKGVVGADMPVTEAHTVANYESNLVYLGPIAAAAIGLVAFAVSRFAEHRERQLY